MFSIPRQESRKAHSPWTQFGMNDKVGVVSSWQGLIHDLRSLVLSLWVRLCTQITSLDSGVHVYLTKDSERFYQIASTMRLIACLPERPRLLRRFHDAVIWYGLWDI